MKTEGLLIKREEDMFFVKLSKGYAARLLQRVGSPSKGPAAADLGAGYLVENDGASCVI